MGEFLAIMFCTGMALFIYALPEAARRRKPAVEGICLVFMGALYVSMWQDKVEIFAVAGITCGGLMLLAAKLPVKTAGPVFLK